MQKSTVTEVLTALYADYGAGEVPDAKIAVWCGLFPHIDDATARAAAKWLLLQGSYGLPKASDFAKAVARVQRDSELPTASDAWVMALHTAADAPAVVKKVLKAFPENFDTTPLANMSTVRGQFLKLYEQELARNMENVGASPELRDDVRRIRAERKRELSEGERKLLSHVEPAQRDPGQASHYDRDAARAYFELTGSWPTWADEFHKRANALSNNGWQREPQLPLGMEEV